MDVSLGSAAINEQTGIWQFRVNGSVQPLTLKVYFITWDGFMFFVKGSIKWRAKRTRNEQIVYMKANFFQTQSFTR